MASRKSVSTLITSPRSQLDFLARFLFFLLAPVLIVRISATFPVLGSLVSIALALLVFLLAEWVRSLSGRRPVVERLLARELAMEEFYKRTAPRPFAYYVFYPLLFPYWLYHGPARREFWFFRGYTLSGLCIVLAISAADYFRHFPPELSFRDYLPLLVVTLLVETFLVLSLLMPVATTVISLHQSGRTRRLLVLLLVGIMSATYAAGRLFARRDPVVSYATMYRVERRTAASLSKAEAAQSRALWSAWRALAAGQVARDGKVLGPPLEAARERLTEFYKEDEAFAFDLWAYPRQHPTLLVLYFQPRRGPTTMFRVIDKGRETTDRAALPEGAFRELRRAAK